MIPLHTLVMIEDPNTVRHTRQTYRYRLNRAWIERHETAEQIARNACIQVPPYMVQLKGIEYTGRDAILTIVIDLEATA